MHDNLAKLVIAFVAFLAFSVLYMLPSQDRANVMKTSVRWTEKVATDSLRQGSNLVRTTNESVKKAYDRTKRRFSSFLEGNF